ncbi:ROK family transcriptional regulator [Vallitalea pronyensis]|uniref:ROK family transcriptional regulator n=1 Tax=Vallitalea pronyensis TaxID=1348613 RepID=A0A8J8MLN8_9FIRM|nr:ROK family transcriptional regulator [Vallitalea pronyensis]QUI24035.1 ROK family transcriptional regulator [Vallitalea pronyensis]
MVSKRVRQIDVKKINRNRIFRYVNTYAPVSKPDISLELGISLPTVLQNINALIKQGLVTEVGEFQSTGGRKATAIAPIRHAYYALGMDITEEHINLVLTDLSGYVLKHHQVYKPFCNSPEYYREIAEVVLAFKSSEVDSDKAFLGVGISVPGIVDMNNHKVILSHSHHSANIESNRFSEFIPYPCVLINHANAAGFAEMYHDDTCMNAVYLSLDNNVGGAILVKRQSILNHPPFVKKLYQGDHFRAGELGHMTLIPEGEKCYCGKKGCVDVYCSAKTLSKHTHGHLDRFFEEMENGNDTLRVIWERYLMHLAIEINNLRMIFDCSIIIGGYVGSYMQPYMSMLKDKIVMNNRQEDAAFLQSCSYCMKGAALGAALQQIEAFLCTV